jgi:hypothetical protein
MNSSQASEQKPNPSGAEDPPADLNELGNPPDNVKGLTVAPRLPGGRPSLVLVSDNSFAASQFTQFPLLALDH